jgi:hypothetical protein
LPHKPIAHTVSKWGELGSQ